MDLNGGAGHRPSRRGVSTMHRCTRLICDADLAASVAAIALSLSAVQRVGATARRSPTAAMNGDREAVRALLKKGLDVNEAQGDGTTALHWAAIKGDAELAQMLIYAGANVRATTRIGAYTPLYLAAKGGYSDVVAALLAGRRRCEGRDRERHDAADDRGRGRRHAIDHVADRERRRHQRQGRRQGRDAADVRRRLQSHRCGEAAARARRRSQGHDQGRRSVRADRA